MCVNASAQATWKEFTLEGDELKGTETQVVKSYLDEDAGAHIALFNTKDMMAVAIQTDKGIFDYSRSSYKSKTVRALVGFYDQDGNLLRKTNSWFLVGDRGNKCFVYDQDIYDYIATHNGYIRFVIPLYNDGSFDTKVPCINTDRQHNNN